MQPFLTGKQVLATAALRADRRGAAPALGKNLPCAFEAPEPTVEAVKEGDKVVRLVVTCACGERVEIDCLYPAGM